MKPNEFISGLINLGQYAMISIQTDEVFRYIQLGLSILTTVVLLCYRVWKWWKEAKADGQISEEEAKEVIKIIQDGVEETKTIIDESEKNKEEKK